MHSMSEMPEAMQGCDQKCQNSCRVSVRDHPQWFRDTGLYVLDRVSDLEERWRVAFRRAVIQALQGMSDEIGRIVPNARTQGHGLHIDIALPDLVGPCGSPVALQLLEVHFARNTGEPLGMWTVRQQLLKLDGYDGLVLTTADWNGGPNRADVLKAVLSDCTPRLARRSY
jgi:hypothetical protein